MSVTAGVEIYAGTLNLTQPMQIEVTAADSATLLAEIGRLMLAAEQGKARYRKLADRAAQIYAPAVHGLGLATFLGWLAMGATWQTALTYAIAVLIITCPCALALAVPAVQIAAASRLFRQGIMVKAADGARAHRRGRHGGVRQDRNADAWQARTAGHGRYLGHSALRRRPRSLAASRHPYALAIVGAAEQRLGTVAAASDIRGEGGRGAQAEHGLRHRMARFRRLVRACKQRRGQPRSGIAVAPKRRSASASPIVSGATPAMSSRY